MYNDDDEIPVRDLPATSHTGLHQPLTKLCDFDESAALLQAYWFAVLEEILRELVQLYPCPPFEDFRKLRKAGSSHLIQGDAHEDLINVVTPFLVSQSGTTIRKDVHACLADVVRPSDTKDDSADYFDSDLHADVRKRSGRRNAGPKPLLYVLKASHSESAEDPWASEFERLLETLPLRVQSRLSLTPQSERVADSAKLNLSFNEVKEEREEKENPPSILLRVPGLRSLVYAALALRSLSRLVTWVRAKFLAQTDLPVGEFSSPTSPSVYSAAMVMNLFDITPLALEAHGFSEAVLTGVTADSDWLELWERRSKHQESALILCLLERIFGGTDCRVSLATSTLHQLSLLRNCTEAYFPDEGGMGHNPGTEWEIPLPVLRSIKQNVLHYGFVVFSRTQLPKKRFINAALRLCITLELAAIRSSF